MPSLDAISDKLNLKGKISASVDTSVEYKLRKTAQIGGYVAIADNVGDSLMWTDSMTTTMKNGYGVAEIEQFFN